MHETRSCTAAGRPRHATRRSQMQALIVPSFHLLHTHVPFVWHTPHMHLIT